ncbi:hypothetical protein [Aliterella atlantica]|uniref:hypothetical protein n=1 Tax=Aliterella atlantica TaxID=1827278 RepID=UPI001185E0FC|nr:hypothetical protein [Aliterella atlantica]
MADSLFCAVSDRLQIQIDSRRRHICWSDDYDASSCITSMPTLFSAIACTVLSYYLLIRLAGVQSARSIS